MLPHLEREIGGGAVSVETAVADEGSGKIEPGPGTVVYSAPTFEALLAGGPELADAIAHAQGDAEPLIVVIERASAVPHDAVEMTLDASAHTVQDVVLTILSDA